MGSSRKKLKSEKSTPVAAILVTSQVVLSNAGYILFRDSFGLADEGRPRSPKRITVDPRLPDEEAAPRVGLQRPLS